MTTVRRMTEYVALTREEFRRRFFERFYDPAFDDVQAELEKVFERAIRSGAHVAPDAGLRNPRQK
jgi:hypothetical protein